MHANASLGPRCQCIGEFFADVTGPIYIGFEGDCRFRRADGGKHCWENLVAI
jgi:hypothetical protein